MNKKTLIHKDDEMMVALESGGYKASEIQRYTKIFRESIPYATLFTNILHRYLTGRLKDSHDPA